MDEQINMERYGCQIRMKDVGLDGQQKLKHARVLVIGAGGLGCPALQYLTGAGIGHIGIVDNDKVEISNLHRQILYSTEDIGKSKAETAASRLQKINPDTRITVYPFRITNKEALSVLREYDLIIDGSDNFATRFMINDACVILNKTLIFGAIGETEGHVGVFHHSSNNSSANLRDLYPSLLPEEAAYTCRETGTLGVMPGLIGTLIASEAIKLIINRGSIFANQLFTYNLFTNQSYCFNIKPSKNASSNHPQTAQEFQQTDYLIYSAIKHEWKEINSMQMEEILGKEKSIVIDVREESEYADIEIEHTLRIPIENLLSDLKKVEHADHLIVICSGGVRSKIGANMLHEHFGKSKNIYSLKGGIRQWKEKLRIYS